MAKATENEYEIVVQEDDGSSKLMTIKGVDADWDTTNQRLTILGEEAKPLGSFIRVLRWHKK